MKGDLSDEEVRAIARALFNPKPMNAEETAAADRAMDKMSDWHLMSRKDLESLIAEEERARKGED